jgi:hypothetical protein
VWTERRAGGGGGAHEGKLVGGHGKEEGSKERKKCERVKHGGKKWPLGEHIRNMGREELREHRSQGRMRKRRWGGDMGGGGVEGGELKKRGTNKKINPTLRKERDVKTPYLHIRERNKNSAFLAHKGNFTIVCKQFLYFLPLHLQEIR